ncbi:MAG: hypothetical protein JST22_14395 [Bacteroidetes bacterium]|nr:hypothetical protein [Bacteroidota bacterium]
MATTWWTAAGILIAAVVVVIGIGSPIVRGRLRAQYPALFAPIDPAAVVFQRAHVRTTVVGAPRIPLRSRECTTEVVVTRDEFVLRPEGPAFMFLPSRFLLLRLPLAEIDVLPSADNLSQAVIRVPTMDRSVHMELWMLMNQYREFAGALLAGGARAASRS